MHFPQFNKRYAIGEFKGRRFALSSAWVSRLCFLSSTQRFAVLFAVVARTARPKYTSGADFPRPARRLGSIDQKE
jgi:hypothetical protein